MASGATEFRVTTTSRSLRRRRNLRPRLRRRLSHHRQSPRSLILNSSLGYPSFRFSKALTSVLGLPPTLSFSLSLLRLVAAFSLTSPWVSPSRRRAPARTYLRLYFSSFQKRL